MTTAPEADHPASGKERGRVSFGHVNIRTLRLDETCAFYERLLGLRRGVAATMPDREQNLWLYDDAGNPCVHVNVFRPGEPVVGGQGSAINHIAFNCPDRAAMEAILQAEGIAYRDLTSIVPGVTQFFLQDPNGVVVELTFGHESLQGEPREG